MSAHSPSTDYIYPTVLPWREIFSDLKAEGVSPYQVACMIGREWSTVQRWVDGHIEPRDSIARAILVIHYRFCGPKQTLNRLQEADDFVRSLVEVMITSGSS